MISSLQINVKQHCCESRRATTYFLLRVLVLTFISLLIPSLANSDVRISGFATLGVSYEDNDNLSFLRDSNQSKDPSRNTSFESDSIFGVQISSAFAENFRSTLQLTYRDRPEQDLDKATELAFLGYRPTHSLDLRLGRMAVDMFRLSDYRRVDYINLWVRPPTELYAWILPSSIDGIDGAYQWSHGNQFWRFKVQYGNTQSQTEFPDGSQVIDGEFDNFIVSTLTIDASNWILRFSHSRAKGATDVPSFVPGLESLSSLQNDVGFEANELATIFRAALNNEIRYSQASLNYNQGPWIFDTEVIHIESTKAIVPKGIAAYISLGRRFNRWIPYVVLSQFDSDQDPYESTADWPTSGFEALRNAAVATLNGVQIEQKTHSIGTRWDVAKKIALKAQWDHTEIERRKFAIWAHTNGASSQDQSVDIFSISLNYLF